jgi:hypothetical protein
MIILSFSMHWLPGTLWLPHTPIPDPPERGTGLGNAVAQVWEKSQESITQFSTQDDFCP